MRMTKRNKELLRLYQRERARGFQAKWALSNARTRLEWEKHPLTRSVAMSGSALCPTKAVPSRTWKAIASIPKPTPISLLQDCNAIARSS